MIKTYTQINKKLIQAITSARDSVAAVDICNITTYSPSQAAFIPFNSVINAFCVSRLLIKFRICCFSSFFPPPSPTAIVLEFVRIDKLHP